MNTIRFSETFDVPLSDLMRAVRKNQLEGIVAKRAGSQYRSGERCGDWLKWRANRGQEFVIGGYIPNGNTLDSVLVGYYEGRDLMYAAGVRAGIPPAFPASPTLAIREAHHAARSVICPNHLLHYSSTINIKGGSSRLKKNAPFATVGLRVDLPTESNDPRLAPSNGDISMAL